jgi:hypothetical protein
MGVWAMPMAIDLAWHGLLVSCGLVLIALFLGLRQWFERRAREADLSSADRRHFRSQDLRRSLGIALMLVLAVGLGFGSRVEPKINGQTNPAFVEVWVFVLVLVVGLLVLAMLDCLATFSYARRHRRSMTEERIRMLEDVLSQFASGASDPPDDDGHASE